MGEIGEESEGLFKSTKWGKSRGDDEENRGPKWTILSDGERRPADWFFSYGRKDTRSGIRAGVEKGARGPGGSF